MHLKRLLPIVFGAVLVTSYLPPAQAADLYAISGANHTESVLYKLDPNTGAVIQTIGSAGVTPPQHITSLAFHPSTGVLYGYINEYVSYNEGQLATLDVNTGAATPLTASSPVHVPDITFGPLGTLYGWNEAIGVWQDDLITFDLSTGAASQAGESGIGTAKTGLASDSQGNLYVKSGSDLYTVDPGTGAATFLKTLSQSLDNALAFDENDNLYSVLRAPLTSYLMKIDIATGNVTTVGDIGVANIAAIAFRQSPVPTESDTWGRLKHVYR